MSQAAKANEPSMEEILASIRRIISDDDAPAAPEKPAAKAPEKPVAKPAADAAPSSQDDIDALLASFDEPEPAPPPKKAETKKAEVKPAPVKEEKGGSQDDIDALLASFEAEVEPEPTPPPPPPKAKAAPPPPPPEDDVLDLIDAVDPEEAMAAGDLAEDDGWGLAAEEEAPAPSTPPPPAPASAPPVIAAAAAPVMATGAAQTTGLMSPDTTAAVSSAFSSLGNLFLASNARTVEGLVEDLMRPMLKAWLDENLPSMVERIVKSEVERISRGR